ncbi:MAG: TusE/DsrC/DsvC family sulfur relay protein [Rhodocyclaceae bacterium]|nr:TusE/DsrC/DsvC family sulfur relay protein [Rhodocyclaceae bacterium]
MDTIFTIPELDSEGYLVDPMEWDEQAAVVLAKSENIDLESEHWIVIRFMRSYYDEHQIAPDARHAIKHLEQAVGAGARNRLFELFPFGYVAQACRIAGMRRPRGWSTG